MRSILVWLCISVSVSAPARADESRTLYLGMGYDDLLGKRTRSLAISAEYASRPVWRGKTRFNVAAMATAHADAWIGAGVSWERQLGRSPWFYDVSFLVGPFYRNSEGRGADSLHFPLFRTQGAIGYRTDKGTLSIALSHHSSAKLDGDAGSTETVWVRYGFEY